jgi:hypothetical protein
MSSKAFRFTFKGHVPMRQVEGTLKLAQLAAQSLHGSERVDLEAQCETDHRQGTVVIDASTNAGRTVAMIFLGYVRREFGVDVVQMDRIDGSAYPSMEGS